MVVPSPSRPTEPAAHCGDRFRGVVEVMAEAVDVFAPVLSEGRLVDLRGVYSNPASRRLRDGQVWHDGWTVRERFDDPEGFIAVARQVWDSGREVRYTLANPGRQRHPDLAAEYLVAKVTRIGDELVAVGSDLSDEYRFRQEAEEHAARLDELVRFDATTGVLSRAGFADAFDDLASRGRSVALVAFELLDLDDATRTFGHQVVEAVVAQYADRLRALTPSELGRLAPGTFAVILQGHDESAAMDLAAAAVDALERPTRAGGVSLRLGCAAGVHVVEDVEIGQDALVRRAQEAAWIAARHRLASSAWRPAGAGDRGEGVQLLADLEEAMASAQLRIELQPKFRLDDGAFTAAEALVRWDHPDHGAIPPGVFIDAVEASSLAGRFTEHVLELALSTWRHHRLALGPAQVAVNVPPALVRSGELADSLCGVLERTGGSAGSLVVELTERELIRDLADTVDGLETLRSMGVRVSVDDFGAGSTSLGALRTLPIDELKLDSTLVRRLELDRVNQAIVRGCVGIAEAIGAEVVAEGIESEVETRAARHLGCAVGQGFALGVPQPIETLVEAVGNWIGRLDSAA